MTRSMKLFAILAMLILGGCATTDSTVSGTRMKLKDYAAKHVGILPVVVNPSFDAKALPLDEIGSSIASALKESTPLQVERVDAQVDGLPFPLTPRRLAEVVAEMEQKTGKKTGLQAVIGASIIAWSPPLGSHRARLSLIISFVDLEHPEKKWIMSGTWKAHDLDGLPQTLSANLGLQLIDLDYWLRSGLIPWFSEQGAAEDPVLTFYSPSAPTGKQERSVQDKSLQLVVSSIDDDGLKALSVRNPAVKSGATTFSWEAPKDVMDRSPIYVSSPVSVPLAFGSNDIVVSARNSKDQVIERKIALRSLSKRGLNVVGVGIEKDGYGFKADDADDAVREIGQAAAAAELDHIVIENEDATRERVFAAIQDRRNSLGIGDGLLIVAAGRGGTSQRSLFLQLFDPVPSSSAEQKSLGSFESESSIHWLRLEDLLTFASGYPALIVLDLCTNTLMTQYTRRSMQIALDTMAHTAATSNVRILGDVSDCEKGVGELSDRVAEQLARSHKPADRTAQQLFANLSGEHPELVAWNGAAPPANAAATGLFWAVAFSTTDQGEAELQAIELQKKGIPSSVVLGTNGVFNIALGSFGSYEQASGELKKAPDKGVPVTAGYVLAPDKVKATVPE
jgi:hypothetical protein